MNWLIITCLTLLLCSFSYGDVIPADDLLSDPEYSMVSISPSGKWISAYNIRGSKKQLILLPKDKSKIYSVLALDDKSQLTSYVWLDDRTLHVTLAKASATKGVVRLFLDDAEPFVNFTPIDVDGYLVRDSVEDDGRMLYAIASEISKDIKNESEYYLHSITLEDLVRQRFSVDTLYAPTAPAALRFFPEGQHGIFAIAKGNKDGQRALLYQRHKDEPFDNIFDFSEDNFDFSPVGFVNKNELALITNRAHQTKSLVIYDTDQSKITRTIFSHEMYDLVGAKFDGSSRSVESVFYYDHGEITPHYFDQALEYEHQKFRKTFAEKQTVVVDRDDSGRYKVIGSFSSSSPLEFFLYDSKNNIANRLFLDRPNLAEQQLNPTKALGVKSSDGYVIEGFLTEPSPEAKNNVLLVMPHGGPVGVRDKNTFNPEIQLLANRGFSVLRVNFRGSAGYGKDFEALGKTQFGRKIESDIMEMVAHVELESEYSAKCTIGSSYGGYSAVQLVVAYPGVFRCAIGMFGVYDLPLLFNASNIKVAPSYRESTAALVGPNDERLVEVSPFYHAQKIDVPILLIAGKDDSIADFEQSNRMRYVLEQLGKKVESVFYSDVAHGHHSWWGERHQYAYVDRFIRKHLGLPAVTGKGADAARADEAFILADGYLNGYLSKNKSGNLIDLYAEAASLGHPEAIFELAKFYMQGKQVEQNVSKAVDLLRRSSAMGHVASTKKLADFYRTSKNLEKNFETSLALYLEAYAVTKDAESSLWIGRAYCLGLGAPKNPEKCYQYMSLDHVEYDLIRNTDWRLRRQIFAELISTGEFNEFELEKVHALLMDAKKNLVIFPFDLDVVHNSAKARNSYSFVIDASGEVAEAPAAIGIGVKIDPLHKANRLQITPVFARWSKKVRDSQEHVFHSETVFAKSGEVFYIRYVPKAEERNESFRLQLFDAFQNLLFDYFLEIN